MMAACDCQRQAVSRRDDFARVMTDLSSDLRAKLDDIPLLSRTPSGWAKSALSDPLALLSDHAHLEKKAANNAMDLLVRWPDDVESRRDPAAAALTSSWVTTMANIARDEGAHLAQVTRLLLRRGGKLTRGHANPYAKALHQLVRKGKEKETIDRLFISALIECRSCERFSVLAGSAEDEELAAFYRALHSSELGHYKSFLKLAYRIAPKEDVDSRWQHMLKAEARILAEQPPGPRIHSGLA